MSFVFTTPLSGSAWAETPSSQPIRVVVTKTSCDPDALTAAAGAATFSITNATGQPLEWEILDGVRVVDERENIPAGETRTLETKLTPGDYQVTCGLISNPKGSLHVDAIDGARPKITAVEFIAPLAEYRFYASGEIDGLVEDMSRLRETLKSGDIAAARALYATVHAHYARLAPIALYFPDLDGEADGQDPDSIGFRRLAAELAAHGDQKSGAVADKLVADIASMQSRFEGLQITPGPTIAGALQSIGGGAAAVLGQSEPLSNADLADLKAYVEGAGKIVDLFQPLLQKTDKPLSLELADDFSRLGAALADYPSAPDAFARPASLSRDDRARLQQWIKRITAELEQIPPALGIG